MADTALTIITDAMLDIGVLADEEVPTAAQAQSALRKLNNMIDSWNIENLAIYGSTQHVIPMTPGHGMYTIGEGGDLNIARPNNITSASARDLTLPPEMQVDYPLYMMSDMEYQNIVQKGLQSPWPNMAIWFNKKYPLIEAYVYPVPTNGNFGVVIWDGGILNNLTLHQEVNLAPGYKRAITANLCIELAPSYGVEVPDTIETIAVQSKADIKTKNLQLNELVPFGRGNGRYNIFTDSANR